jgi:hypothetical protein
VRRYSKGDVHHYLHMDFHHVPRWLEIHKSVALHKNEGLECVNSEDKQFEQNHGTHDEMGQYMTKTCCVHHGRKLLRFLRDDWEEDAIQAEANGKPHRQIDSAAWVREAACAAMIWAPKL